MIYLLVAVVMACSWSLAVRVLDRLIDWRRAQRRAAWRRRNRITEG